MKPLHLPENIKVHFAGGEVQSQYLAVQELGVRYSLFTCYPWVERMIFEHATSPIITLKWQRENSGVLVPQNLSRCFSHVIQDSGLFTLMFGSQKQAKKDAQLIGKWYDGLVEFTLNHGCPVTCVEVDCQKVLGVQAAWEFREMMRRDLPNNRIINVFHLEDGQKGLDRLIEFSDYIAVSVPEMRFAGKKNYVANVARYIKRKKPTIDIHLLGCTEISLLHECRFCTSADSTSWLSGKRFGYINGKHVRTIDVEKAKKEFGAKSFDIVAEYNSPENVACMMTNVEIVKEKYQQAAGPQDYFLND